MFDHRDATAESASRVPPYARWDRIAEFKPCGGIRIEDDVVSTGGEPLNLMREGFATG